MRKLMLILACLFLTSCGNKENTVVLSTPVNIYVEDHIVHWDEVQGASKYSLEINGLTRDALSNSFDLAKLGSGEYSFRVKARNAKDVDSAYSTFATHVIDTLVLGIPENLKIENQIITWDKVANASGYRVFIENEVFSVLDNSYTLVLNDLNNCDIMIKSLGDNRYKDSDFSYILSYNKSFSLDLAFQIIVDKATPEDLVLDLEGIFTINMDGAIVEPENYECGNTLVLKQTFVNSINKEIQLLIIQNEEKTYQVTLNLMDSRVPYLDSSFEVNYEHSDVTLTFNIYAGNIIGIFGHNITTNDYSINGNDVTIYKEFIESLDLNNIVLAFKIKNANNLSIGYILIRNGE